MLNFEVEEMCAADWPQVAAIYQAGIDTRNATFETAVPAWEKWDAIHRPECRLVARNGDQILGWVALTPYSAREVYAGVAELAVYIAPVARGQGVGRALINALIAVSEQVGIWTLQAGIFAENAPSIALHTACGFRVVGVRERIGQLYGVWHDVVLMERRSKTVNYP
jgi:L-amino acid N-acyltransferase YncA